MDTVKIWEEEVLIPTYQVGEAERLPVFSEKRVYQGSSGKIYPYPTIEKISDEKVDMAYKAVYLENEYIKIMILPELGGRIHRAYDKTNDYDFVYYNHVIKPALVGLAGPWISGGIEFNWPQHHRPTTFMPVDYQLKEHKDGSKTLEIHDVDQMYGTAVVARFTLYPGKAYIEINGQLYNRTPLPQTFLWWANPAVAVNDYTQSIFPPDVHAVMDHGKRDVSRFPIATGIYYKHDYSEGVDISRYKNIPVPTSYMVEKSNYDFVGGYDHNIKAGILHVADHHISPGKKQWTWGCGEFGKAWDRNLTDADGPYIELMTGVYTDNQPDFTWLKPFEEKNFKQYFMPYKAVGAVKNASIHAAVNLELNGNEAYICVYATEKYENATIILSNQDEVVLKETVTISPVDIYEKTVTLSIKNEANVIIKVYNEDKLLVEYQPILKDMAQIPSPAEAPKKPEEIMTNEELYLTGLHIEQYRHATYMPDTYYLEALKRDQGDIRVNNAYGTLLMRRGCFEEAEQYLRKALERSTWKNPNPYNSEPYYNLGLVLFYQGKYKDAYDAFYKATWTNEQQEMSFYYLAAIDAMREEFEKAFEHINRGLIKNSHNIKARGLKAYLYRKLGKELEAVEWMKEILAIDGFDYVSMVELSIIDKEHRDEILLSMKKLMRDFSQNYLQTARDYAEFGAYKEAIHILSQCSEENPMLYYYKAYYSSKLGLDTSSLLSIAENACSDYCFPNKLEDIAVLSYVSTANPTGPNAYYYLGNLFYDKLQYEKATDLWEKSAELNSNSQIVLRNLSLAYYNKFNRPDKARELLEKAFSLDRSSSRIFLELDQLYKKIEESPEFRLANYERYKDTIIERDDLFIEYITLHNLLGKYEEAYQLMNERRFHPWEGGEGKIVFQYTFALVQMAKKAIIAKDFEAANDYLQKALVYPENLGEGKLEGTKDNHIYYYLGIVKEYLGDKKAADSYYHQATIGNEEPAGVMYYNDQPADMILYQGLAYLKLGEIGKANAKFTKLIDYGERHVFDDVKIEYFAVSLPDFLIFNDDLNVKNQAHCYYLIGLGHLGFGRIEKANQYFDKAMQFDKYHQNYMSYHHGGI